MTYHNIADASDFSTARTRALPCCWARAGIATLGSRFGVDTVSADYLANPAAAPYFELAAGPRRPAGSPAPRPGRLPRRPRLAGEHPPHVLLFVPYVRFLMPRSG